MSKQLAIFALVLLMFAFMKATPPAEAAPTTSRSVCSGVLCDFTTIQAAIDASSDGDTVLVQTGVHTEAGIFVSKNLTIAGLGESVTFIQAAPDVNFATNRVFEIAVGKTVTLKDLAVRHGATTSGNFFSIHGENGGGILNRGHLTLYAVDVSNNQTGRGFDCSTDGCTAGNGGEGGGIYNAAGAHLIVIRSTIDTNRTGDGADCSGMPCNLGRSGHGAGIYSMGSLQVTKSTFYVNATGAAGFCNSTACFTNDVDLGGAVYNGNFALIRNSTLHANVASNGGGVATVSDAETSLNNVTITNNVIRVIFQKSGGVYNENRTFISNSIVADNSDDQCGGPANVAAFGANTSDDSSCTGFTQTGTFTDLRGIGAYFGGLWVNPPDWDSPVLDVGMNCETTDQRGLNRLSVGGLCDLGAFEKTVHTQCNMVNTPIEDNSLFYNTNLITVTQKGLIIDVKPQLTLTHPYVGDLDARINRNGANGVTLFDRPGTPSGSACSGANVNAAFFDGAARVAEDTCFPLSPTLSGDLRPDQLLASYLGESLDATWRMSVRDTVTGDAGTFDAWCLNAEYVPDTSADSIIQTTVSTSQLRIGPDDSFYLRVDVQTGTTGWIPANGDLFTIDAVTSDINGGDVVAGTPIVPSGTDVTCTRPGGVGTFFRCGGTAGASLGASKTYTFYFPYSNPTGVAGCDAPGFVTAILRDKNASNLDILRVPECVATSQGSTMPPAQAAPTAVGLGEVGVENSAEILPVLLAIITTAVTAMALRKRINA